MTITKIDKEDFAKRLHSLNNNSIALTYRSTIDSPVDIIFRANKVEYLPEYPDILQVSGQGGDIFLHAIHSIDLIEVTGNISWYSITCKAKDSNALKTFKLGKI